MRTNNRKKRKFKSKTWYPTNRQIRHSELRVFTGEGESLGILKLDEAIAEAKKRALDLVLITKNAKPPVAKILDFNKFLYEKNKKNTQGKAKSKVSKVKEFRFGLLVDDEAITMRANRAIGFIEEGNRVKITITMKGRQQAHPELAFEKIGRFVKLMEASAKPEAPAKRMGRSISITLVKR